MGRRGRGKGLGRDEPLQVWRRAVRRALRDFVRERSAVPGLVCFVSRGADPRRVELLRLELCPDSRAVRALIVEEVRRFGAHFAAYGGLMSVEDARYFGLLVCDATDSVTDGADVSETTGLGAWREGTFKLGDDFRFVQRALAGTARDEQP